MVVEGQGADDAQRDALGFAGLDDPHGLVLEALGHVRIHGTHADFFVDGLKLLVGHVPLLCRRLSAVASRHGVHATSQRGPARWILICTSGDDALVDQHHVDLVERADDDLVDEPDLVAVGEHHDLAARAPDHGELDAGHGHERRGEAGAGVQAVGAQERLVRVEAADHVDGPGALDGVEAGPVQAAEEDELDVETLGLCGGRQAVGDDARLEGRVHVAKHGRDGGARAQEHRVPGLDHGCRGSGDARLLLGVRLGGTGRIELLLGGGPPHEHRAAVRAAQHALAVQQLEVAADGDLGDAEDVAERGHLDDALLMQCLHDARAALGRQHLRCVGHGHQLIPMVGPLFTERSSTCRTVHEWSHPMTGFRGVKDHLGEGRPMG